MTQSASSRRSVDKPSVGSSRLPAKPPVKPKTGKDFGSEGTNKTASAPKPDGALPEELGIAPYIEKSPYTRG